MNLSKTWKTENISNQFNSEIIQRNRHTEILMIWLYQQFLQISQDSDGRFDESRNKDVLKTRLKEKMQWYFPK